MKYESDIAEMIHEMAMEKFKIGIISEARMREYDEMCLSPDTLQDTAAQGDIAKHADLVTA
jgi:DNA-binding transcriptional regulator YiaG